MLLLTAEAQLFDLSHNLYMIISSVLTAVILVLAYLFIKKQSYKDAFLKLWAIITVVIHYSIMWVQYLKNEAVEVGSNMLFPTYACNACMWMLLAVALIKNKESMVFRILAEFVFWAGIVCGCIGILLNDNYIGSVGLSDYGILKGLVSHSTMLLGAIYLLVGGFIKIRVFNVISVACGLTIFCIDGLIVNGIFVACGLDNPNSMYLSEPPFDNMPWLNTAFIGLVAVSVCFIITVIYEFMALKKEDRWYTRLKEFFSKHKNHKKA